MEMVFAVADNGTTTRSLAGGLTESFPSGGDCPESFFKAHYSAVKSFAYSMLRSHEEAEDVTMECYANLLQRFDTVIKEKRYGYWIRSVRNRSIDVHRRQEVRGYPISLSDPVTGTMYNDCSTVEDFIADKTESVSSCIERRELQEIVHNAVAVLTDDQREVIILHHLHGVELNTIAAQRGIVAGTIKSRLGRGRARIATKIAPDIEGRR